MKTIIFKNPDGVDEKVLEKIEQKLKNENINYEFFEDESKIKNADFCIAFGGDGTIIHAAKICAEYKKAVLGINGGHFGYTAGLECDEINMISEISKGNFFIDKRAILEVTLGDKKYFCVNDAVVSKGALSRMIDISLYIGKREVTKTSSDGIIVSTPTGSTAYSLSAGGPILDPSVNSIVITSICPHSLYDRPIVINDKEEIKIKFIDKRNSESYLTIDGETSIKLKNNDIVKIKKIDNYTADLIRIKQENFLDILNKKFLN
ncbi:MAG: NAD(+)/NADH kinase [Clostridia bacterium]|nr:NAD(+)/NADH kinase [Clostridia bacterium]